MARFKRDTQNAIVKNGSIFMGNPIVFLVDAHAEPSTSDVTFHRVILKVSFNSGAYSQELSMPVRSGQCDVEFDVSSVFRAFAEQDVYSPIAASTNYLTYTARIEARDVWMKDGVLIDPAPSSDDIEITTCTAIKGKFSDLERLKGVLSSNMSRKPVSPEIVCVGDKVVFGQNVPNVGPMSVVKTIVAAEENTIVHVANGQIFFVLPASEARNSYQFQFVNSRGVVESIRAWALATEKMKSKNDVYTISRIETFSRFARTLIHKHANTEELTLCSGFVTYEWAKWWMDEFCQSEHYWMLYDGVWVPCNVTIDDTATLIDRTKSQMCYVSFTCRPNVNGLLM